MYLNQQIHKMLQPKIMLILIAQELEVEQQHTHMMHYCHHLVIIQELVLELLYYQINSISMHNYLCVMTTS